VLGDNEGNLCTTCKDKKIKIYDKQRKTRRIRRLTQFRWDSTRESKIRKNFLHGGCNSRLAAGAARMTINPGAESGTVGMVPDDFFGIRI